MPSAMSLISSTVLSSTSTGFSFSSIPSTYDDLIVKMSIRGSSERLLMAFNGTTSSNYNLSTFGIALTSLASLLGLDGVIIILHIWLLQHIQQVLEFFPL